MGTRSWFKGDTHLHTVNSDGILTKGQLVERCKQQGLDFMIITDHNFNSVDANYYDGDMLVIRGEEITGDNGHVNIWGAGVPVAKPYNLNSKENYKEIINECKKAGATVSLNHPFCSQCGFRFDIDDVDCDCVEVWNTVQHTDNIVNRDWWVNQLLSGRRIAAVGGSDYHRNYAGLNILAHPTTFVLAEKNAPEEILRAMREGRCVITNSPDSTFIEMTCGDAVLGDEVELDNGKEVQVTVYKLPPLHKVTVYSNNKPVFSESFLKGSKSLSFSCRIKEKGPVWVEVSYEFKGPLKELYKFAEKKFLKGTKDFVPPFLRAFTNPIWFI